MLLTFRKIQITLTTQTLNFWVDRTAVFFLLFCFAFCKKLQFSAQGLEEKPIYFFLSECKQSFLNWKMVTFKKHMLKKRPILFCN